MCGRYTLAAPASELMEAFDVPELTFESSPRYNIARSQSCPIVAEDRRGRRIGLMEWGLVPAWKDEPTGGLINARAESLDRKPAFRQAFGRRRCLVPADGFYEWQRVGSGKSPFWIHPRGRGLMAFAGLWERWQRPGAAPRFTFTIVTVDAAPDLAPIHDRTPAVLAREDWATWLEPETDAAALKSLLRPIPEGTMEARPVSTRVNRPAEDDAGLIETTDGA